LRSASANAIGPGGVEARLCRLSPTISRILRLEDLTAEKYSLTSKKVLGVVSDAAELAGVVCDTLHVEHEQVYQAIIEAAEARRRDLIVMASHGRRGVSAVVLGSETVKVLTLSKIPVLVYRSGCFRRLVAPTAPILCPSVKVASR
jgi:nucleotide-binding universal stress UspA family protein